MPRCDRESAAPRRRTARWRPPRDPRRHRWQRQQQRGFLRRVGRCARHDPDNRVRRRTTRRRRTKAGRLVRINTSTAPGTATRDTSPRTSLHPRSRMHERRLMCRRSSRRMATSRSFPLSGTGLRRRAIPLSSTRSRCRAQVTRSSSDRNANTSPDGGRLTVSSGASHGLVGRWPRRTSQPQNPRILDSAVACWRGRSAHSRSRARSSPPASE